MYNDIYIFKIEDFSLQLILIAAELHVLMEAVQAFLKLAKLTE